MVNRQLDTMIYRWTDGQKEQIDLYIDRLKIYAS